MVYLFGVFCSALAAFYTRNFAEKVPDIKPPLLQVAQYANGLASSLYPIVVIVKHR